MSLTLAFQSLWHAVICDGWSLDGSQLTKTSVQHINANSTVTSLVVMGDLVLEQKAELEHVTDVCLIRSARISVDSWLFRNVKTLGLNVISSQAVEGVWPHVPELPALTSLRCVYTPLSDEQAMSLTSLKNLKILSVERSGISSEVESALRLKLRNAHLVTGIVPDYIAAEGYGDEWNRERSDASLRTDLEKLRRAAVLAAEQGDEKAVERYNQSIAAYTEKLKSRKGR